MRVNDINLLNSFDDCRPVVEEHLQSLLDLLKIYNLFM